MPFQVDDPFAWSANMPDDIQAQIAGQLGASPSEFDWDGLMPSDIGGEMDFGASDFLQIGVSALSVLSPNADAASNLFNLAKWALRAEVGFMGQAEDLQATQDVMNLRDDLGLA